MRMSVAQRRPATGTRRGGLSLAGWRRLQRPRPLLVLAALCVLLQLAAAVHASDLDQHAGGGTCITCVALAQTQAAGSVAIVPTLPPATPGPAPLAVPIDSRTAPACAPRSARAPPLAT
jgi:hypothetical protein